MKLCPTCQNKYPDDANFCPREECAGEQGPQRLEPIAEEVATRFVPISRLGGGASGEVWQANDAETGTAVAYKVVAAEVLPTAVALERTQRELRQLQRASSARIVKVVDFGKTPEGRLFIASELASGEPLDQVVARTGPFPLDRAKRVAAQIGEALLEAQKVGVVHRDLAAKNILVSGDDEVRVINFAVARPLADNLLGVPEYMSPEQSEGKLIDQRSNTYSLGALLYLMLTGHPPHQGATPQAILEAIQKGEITPPSIKRGGGLTAEVDRIVLKALERNSSRRPLTMRQFLTDVAGLVVTEQASSAGAAGASRDAGFAKTMMFAGGASEVQKLVAQAVAARQGGGGGAGAGEAAAGTPAAAPAQPAAAAPRAPTPAPVAATPPPISDPASGGRAAHGAAVAATMIAVPAPGAAIPGSSASAPPGGTPAPVPHADTPAHTPPPAVAGSDAAGGNFRETLWFKKGDVDQMVAEARAKVAAMAAQKATPAVEPEAVAAAAEENKPLEDRYLDDGTVTTEDRKKFSLRSGATSTSMPAKGGHVPGERMSDNEMLGEIGGGKRFMIIGIVAAVVVALIAVVVVSMRGKGKEEAAPRTEQAAPVPEKAAGDDQGTPAATDDKAAKADEKAAASEKAVPAEKAAADKGEQAEKGSAEPAAADKKEAREPKEVREPKEPKEPSAKSAASKKKSAAKKKASSTTTKKKK